MTSLAERLLGLGGDVAVVTGGASGIGEAISHHLAGLGAKVVIVDRDAAGAQRVAEAIIATGGKAASQTIDLGADEAAVVDGVAAIVAAHGIPSILVNNAGIQDREPMFEISADQWDRMMRINLRGAFLMLRECGKAMVGAGVPGRVVNIASMGVAHPMIEGLSAYSASKAGLCGLTRNAAFELMDKGIRVNAVLPGGVATPGSSAGGAVRKVEGPATRGWPLGKIEPADIAGAVAYLVSPAAAKVTAQFIGVDSGFLLT